MDRRTGNRTTRARGRGQPPVRPGTTSRTRVGRNSRSGSGSRTVSISLRDRGQTTQDFVVGIGVFLLAIAFVFSYVPTLLTPYSSSVSAGDTAQADRIAATVLEELTDDGSPPNHVNGSAFEQRYASSNSSQLAGDLGLRITDGEVAIDRVNISIESLNQSVDRANRSIISGGDRYSGGSAASSARIVTVDFENVDVDDLRGIDTEEEKEDACDPACRLVVRVW